MVELYLAMAGVCAYDNTLTGVSADEATTRVISYDEGLGHDIKEG